MDIKQRAEGAVLQDVIAELDVAAVGIANLSEWKGTKLEEAAIKLLPEASSVVVFAMEIYPEVLDLTSPGRIMGEASFNDLMPRHAEFVCGRLTKAAYDVAKASRKMGLKSTTITGFRVPHG